MLRVVGISDPTGRYYLDDPAGEVTDLSHNAHPGSWQGRGAERLGLIGAVRADDLQHVLRGTPPNGTVNSDPRRKRTAFDLTFGAPKPVSVLFTTRDDAIALAVLGCHERAVIRALDYLEARAAAVQRVDREARERVSLPVHGLVAATFTHGASRSGDVHLHTHAVIANMAHGVDGRFGALDQRGLRAHSRAADALYRAQLRHELRRELSVVWERSSTGSEAIRGVTKAQCIALSGRSAEVRSGVRARPEKVFLSRSQALDVWHRRLVAQPALEPDQNRDADQLHLDEHRFGSIVSRERLTARVVVEAWADSAWGGLDSTTVAAALGVVGTPLGHGVSEVALAERRVVASNRDRASIGPRPTDRDRLERWWRESRPLRDRAIVDRSQALGLTATAPRGRSIELG